MKFTLYILYIVTFSSVGLSHEANEAFFRYTQYEDRVEVAAEFPWTLRNALLNFNPSLENASSSTEFKKTFITYLKKNLVLKNNRGDSLEFKGYTELENTGHSHQSLYIITFKGTHLSQITNTLMFNQNANQLNYNTVISGSKSISHNTYIGNATFDIAIKNSRTYYYFVVLIFFLLGYLVYRWYRRKGIA